MAGNKVEPEYCEDHSSLNEGLLFFLMANEKQELLKLSCNKLN